MSRSKNIIFAKTIGKVGTSAVQFSAVFCQFRLILIGNKKNNQ